MPQANSTTSRPRCTSPRASESTLPCSSVISSASSLACALTSSRKAKRTLVRRLTRGLRPLREGAAAAATAASTSAGRPSTTSACCWPVAGLKPGRCGSTAPEVAVPAIQCSMVLTGGVLASRGFAGRASAGGADDDDAAAAAAASSMCGPGRLPSDRGPPGPCSRGAAGVTRLTCDIKAGALRGVKRFVLTFSQRLPGRPGYSGTFQDTPATARRYSTLVRTSATGPSPRGLARRGWCPARGRTSRRSRACVRLRRRSRRRRRRPGRAAGTCRPGRPRCRSSRPACTVLRLAGVDVLEVRCARSGPAPGGPARRGRCRR